MILRLCQSRIFASTSSSSLSVKASYIASVSSRCAPSLTIRSSPWSRCKSLCRASPSNSRLLIDSISATDHCVTGTPSESTRLPFESRVSVIAATLAASISSPIVCSLFSRASFAALSSNLTLKASARTAAAAAVSACVIARPARTPRSFMSRFG